MNWKSDEPCIVCGEDRDGYVTYHHLLTRKTYQEFQHKSWNKIPVCKKHHGPGQGVGFHDHNTGWMAIKFPSVKAWLLEHGWSICPASGKWRPDGF